MVLLCLGIWLSWRVLKGYSYAAPGGEGAEGAWAQGGDHRPYAYVRHHTYARVILIGAGVPLLLGSRWGLLAVLFFMLELAFRAVMEEHMLIAELEGYADYAKRVRYHFVPLLW